MTPNQDVVSAIEAGITHVTRRVEIFEADGVTPFYPNGSDEDKFRLIGGSVNIDGGRAERRGLDITLDNVDNLLRPNSDRGFWYDKIIKPWRGVRYASVDYTPRILIIEAESYAEALKWKVLLGQLGFKRVDINLNATSLSHLSGYGIICADGGANAITKGTLLSAAFAAGFNIFTRGLKNGVDELPWVTGETNITNAAQLQIVPRTVDTPLAGGWSTESEGAATATGITSLDATGVGVATSLNNSVTHFTASIKATDAARWFDYKPRGVGTQAKALWVNALKWLWNYTPYVEWETPLGLFQIDGFKTQNFPNQIGVTARDFTKKCLKSKIRENMSFDENTKVSDFVIALAANAGITRIAIPSSSAVIGTKIDATRGTERWALMSQAASLIKNDLYFDLEGYLRMTPWADPTLGSPVASFKTGKQGNLASFDRSSSDDRIYNHIVVTGTPNSEEPEALGYFAEARNTNPASPTNINRLGERSYFYTSSFFTSNAQCQAHANALLGQTAFEQYELNMAHFVYPWMDANVVVDFQEPDALETDPTRFLATNMTVPLDLSMMQSGAKRVVFIESTNNEEAAA